MSKLTATERDLLTRVRDGWLPLWLQVGGVGRRLEKRGLVKVDYAPDGHRDAGKLVVMITQRGIDALEGKK